MPAGGDRWARIPGSGSGARSDAPGEAIKLRLAQGVVMSLQLIPAGVFTMGSRGHHSQEEPQRLVEIACAFYLGTCPVTQAEFKVWAKAAGVEHGTRFEGDPTHPADQVDWSEALDFCFWLNRTQRKCLPAGYLATIPTEAEWEYACRAGTDTEYFSGDGEAALAQVGWYAANSKDTTHPVGSAGLPNAWGLYDMHGQVWEWCWDVFDAEAHRKLPNGVCDPSCNERAEVLRTTELPGVLRADPRHRAVRGGAWFDDAWRCRSAYRDGGNPHLGYAGRGFRVCLVPGPVRQEKASMAKRLKTEPGGTPRRSRKLVMRAGGDRGVRSPSSGAEARCDAVRGPAERHNAVAGPPSRLARSCELNRRPAQGFAPRGHRQRERLAGRV